MTKLAFAPLRTRKTYACLIVFLIPLVATVNLLYMSEFSTDRLRGAFFSVDFQLTRWNRSFWFMLGSDYSNLGRPTRLVSEIPVTRIPDERPPSQPPPPLDSLLEQQRSRQEKMRRGEVPLRAVIVRCIGNDMCGGLGDRLFGIVALYMAAMLADRAVFVEHAKPLPLSDYLIPNAVDWRIGSVQNDTVKQTLLRELRVGRYVNMQLPYQHCVDLLRFPLSQANPAVVIMNCNFRTNCLLKLLLQHKFFPEPGDQGLLKNFNRTHERSLRFWASAVTHFILKQLFEFSPLVRSHGLAILNKTVLPRDFGAKETTECLICVHVRSGKNTGESDRHHNIADFGKCAYMVEQGIAKADTCPRKPYWVVISDHPDAPSIVGANFSTPLSTNSVGPIVHVDRIGVGAAHRSGAMRLFVDFFVLSRCKHFVASMSTLGETASMLHGPSVRRFDMDHSGMCSSTPSNIHDWQRDVHISKAEWLKSLEH